MGHTQGKSQNLETIRGVKTPTQLRHLAGEWQKEQKSTWRGGWETSGAPRPPSQGPLGGMSCSSDNVFLFVGVLVLARAEG